MILAGLGADIIKIEPPSGGMTCENPLDMQDDETFGGYFQSVNRSKRSMVLDLKSDVGLDVAKRLIEDADVVAENFRVGRMNRLGLSYETLKERNLELVYASIHGFGDPRGGESPHADRPAFDVIAQAIGGIMGITGTEESGPTKAGPGVRDIFPAVMAVAGITNALHHRERTDEGQYVDVSMIDSMLSLTERIVHQYSSPAISPYHRVTRIRSFPLRPLRRRRRARESWLRRRRDQGATRRRCPRTQALITCCSAVKSSAIADRAAVGAL